MCKLQIGQILLLDFLRAIHAYRTQFSVNVYSKVLLSHWCFSRRVVGIHYSYILLESFYKINISCRWSLNHYNTMESFINLREHFKISHFFKLSQQRSSIYYCYYLKCVSAKLYPEKIGNLCDCRCIFIATLDLGCKKRLSTTESLMRCQYRAAASTTVGLTLLWWTGMKSKAIRNALSV